VAVLVAGVEATLLVTHLAVVAEKQILTATTITDKKETQESKKRRSKSQMNGN